MLCQLRVLMDNPLNLIWVMPAKESASYTAGFLQRRIPSLDAAFFIYAFKRSLSLRLIINGEEREIQSSVNITELLLELEIKGSHLAVAINSQVVPRLSYEKTLLSQDDQIEIVTAVGGGK